MAFLLVLGIGATVYTWYVIQSLNGTDDRVSETGVSSDTVPTPEYVPAESSTTSAPAETGDVVIKLDTLTDTQRSMLSAFGYKGSEVVITEETITCAKGALGDARLTEIINGSAPNPLEAVKLARCMQ